MIDGWLDSLPAEASDWSDDWSTGLSGREFQSGRHAVE